MCYNATMMCRCLILAMLLLAGCTSNSSAPAKLADNPPPPEPVLIHLPGVSGTSIIDHTLRDGLVRAGFDGPFEFFDWTCRDPGIPALHNRARNLEQAKILAEKITKQFREYPDQPIYLTCHSGGSGPAVWALEALPEDVNIECFVLLAPALSPGYDLSKAMSRVRGKVYCFYSEADDMILGTGTRLMGTIDGVRCDAAGRVGFNKPVGVDEAQYAKLVQKPYERAWTRYGHLGGHIGVMQTAFAQAVIGPLMLGREPTAEEQNLVEKRQLREVYWPK
jgi:hypothetical protein